MEETLTGCLVRVREDLSQLKNVRAYLDTNAETEERCSVTWRTIEAFNSILCVCSSQNSQETNALDTLLDSFYYLARNNSDDSVWDDFGFELGLICVKVLSAIERTDVFEVLFCKLLSVISIICEHNSNVWKATARQILNVLINKKFSLSYLEAIVKLYINILKNIDSSILSEFSSQNLHLLKTLSLLVQKVGDFEIQSSVIELVFLHLSKQTKLMRDFFSATETKLFQSLQFIDFEQDCRLYLNGMNKRSFERKVYSICCHVVYLGGCLIEPPIGKSSLWVDANKDSERVSIKCGDEHENRVVAIQFADILNVQLENEKTQGNRCLTVRTKNLMALHKDARNDDVCLIADNTEDVLEFVQFLKTVIAERKRRKKLGSRGSKTMDYLVVDRNNPKLEVQDNSVTSSEKPSVDHILPDVFTLFEKVNQTTVQTFKTSPRTASQQQLSPTSFAESLSKHIGMGSPELRHTYEDSIETIEFLQKATPSHHKLFRSPDKMFDIFEKPEPDFNFSFGENKENLPKPKMKTYSRRSRKPETPKVLKDRRNIEIKISNTESQDYFRTDKSVLLKKKPSLPKIKRNKKPNKNLDHIEHEERNEDTPENTKIQPVQEIEHKESQHENKQKPETESYKEKPRYIQTRQQERENSENELRVQFEEKEKQKGNTKQGETGNSKEKSKYTENKQPKISNSIPDPYEREREFSEPKEQQKSNRKPGDVRKNKPEIELTKTNGKPSLLDPNGYAYQRWCKPTTSERSNFWLKKLNATPKPSRMDSDSVFDFSEDSDSIFSKRKHKKRVVGSKPRTKQTSLRQVKELLKKSSPPKPKPRASPRLKEPTAPTAPSAPSPTTEPEPIIGLSDISKRSSSPENLNEPPADSEYESVSEDEEPAVAVSRRECSDEGSSSKKCMKNSKTVLSKNILSKLRQRLRKKEEKDRQQTDEIIQTVNRATNHLFNHFQRKDGERVVSYLKVAEAASEAFEGEIDELNIRLKRMHRMILYYKTGCSVTDLYESLAEELSKVRGAMKDFKGRKDSWKKIEQGHNRLRDLIKLEVEKSISDEWEMKRSRLLKCATILGVDFREFG